MTFHLLGSSEVDDTFRARLEIADKISPAQMGAVNAAMERAVGETALSLESQLILLATAVSGADRILRRSYSYDAGVDPNGLMDSGLIFICFQRDPARQFVAIQRRLAERDVLNAFSQHVASAVFACPPAAAAGSWFGAGLFT